MSRRYPSPYTEQGTCPGCGLSIPQARDGRFRSHYRRAREEAPGSQCANEIEGWTRPIIYCDRGHESTDIRGYKDKDPEFDKYHFHCQDCRLSLQVKPDLLELLLEPFRKAGMEKVPLQVLILAQQRGMVKR